jgi:hypothetical protein
MNNKDILDNAPDGATHLQYCSDGVDVCYLKIGENFYFHDDKSWLKVSPILANISSIEDIKRIAELEEENERLKQRVNDTFDYCESVKKELPIRDLEQQAKYLQFALENITNPDLIYKKFKEAKGGAE